MATTRLKVSNKVVVYHRHSASNDAPEVDVATSELLASQLGSSNDFELQADDSIAMADKSFVTSTTVTACGSGNIDVGFIYIENTGYTDATKITTTTSGLKIYVNAATTNYFTLNPGQSVFFNAPLGTTAENAHNYKTQSTSGDIYVKVIVGN